MAADDYQEELLSQWWNRWKVVGLPPMIPYQRQKIKDAKRHKNLQVGDVCLLQYDRKIKHTYRLCIMLETFPSKGNIVCTVKVGFRPRRQCRTTSYKPVQLDELVVGVPRLVLIVPQEEMPKANTNHVLKLGPTSCPVPPNTTSARRAAVEELGVDKHDQAHAVHCVNYRHLMGANF